MMKEFEEPAIFKVEYKKSEIKKLIEAYDIILADLEKSYNFTYKLRQELMDRDYQHGKL